jgi:hypothetical protein
MCDFDSYSSDAEDRFNSRFKKFQDLVHMASPYIGLGAKNALSKDSSTKIPRPKTLPSTRNRTKITPLIKERTNEGQETRQRVSQAVAEADGFLNERTRNKLTEMADTIVLTRNFLTVDMITTWTEKFIEDYKVKVPKGKERAVLILIYCIIMACRLNGIFLDVHLLAINLDVPVKNIMATINENVPPITTKCDLHKRLLGVVINSSRNALAEEFAGMMVRVVSAFPSEPPVQVTEEDVQKYKKNCISLFTMLESDVSCDYDRQFCVTPDKVYIYGIFDVVREKVRSVTERVICDYLSSKFMIPRVTIEKMKRLVVKCRSSQS